MKINMTEEWVLPARELAKALAEAPPEEFADFWAGFSGQVETNNIDLDALGRAMAVVDTSRRISTLRTICNAMDAEIYRQRKPPRKLEPETTSE